MKSIWIAVIILILALPLMAVKESKPLPKTTYVIGDYQVLHLPGLQLGVGSIEYKKRTTEFLINAHINPFENGFIGGLFYQFNSFKRKDRTGFYYLGMLGGDLWRYTYQTSQSFSLGLSREDKLKNPARQEDEFVSKKKVAIIAAPNLSFGGGYSFALNEDSQLRISTDIGIKLVIIGLNISIYF
jgi:opacity protein-like surface antigen